MRKEKIEREIEHIQGELSILTELQRGIRTLKRKYKINKDNINIIKETVKQKMQLEAQRCWRYEKRDTFYCQNMIFKRDVRSFIEKQGKKL